MALILKAESYAFSFTQKSQMAVRHKKYCDLFHFTVNVAKTFTATGVQTVCKYTDLRHQQHVKVLRCVDSSHPISQNKYGDRKLDIWVYDSSKTTRTF